MKKLSPEFLKWLAENEPPYHSYWPLEVQAEFRVAALMTGSAFYRNGGKMVPGGASLHMAMAFQAKYPGCPIYEKTVP